MLQSKTFVVDRLPPWQMGALQPMMVSRFVGHGTLQNLRFVDVRLELGQGRLGSLWAWSSVVIELVDILLKKNAFERLRVMIKIYYPGDPNLWTDEAKHYQVIIEKVILYYEYYTSNPCFSCLSS